MPTFSLTLQEATALLSLLDGLLSRESKQTVPLLDEQEIYLTLKGFVEEHS